MTSTLAALGWSWKRVGGSQVLHLVPPDVRRSSRTACYRLAVFDMLLSTPEGLFGEVRTCQDCYARQGRRA